MNERFRLNSSLVKEWLAVRHLKQAYLAEKLRCSGSYVAQMMRGIVPSEAMLEALANLVGVEKLALLIPRDDEKKSA